MSVFVVTETRQGWNFPIAVFSGVKWETLERRFPVPHYTIDEFDVEKNIKNYPLEIDDE
jgi:diaminopimelate decarboxylase